MFLRLSIIRPLRRFFGFFFGFVKNPDTSDFELAQDPIVPTPACPAARAATQIYVSVRHMIDIHKGQLPPVLNSGVPLGLPFIDGCYGTCRVPDKQCDYLKYNKFPRHGTTLVNGCWYKLNVCDKNGRVYSPAEFELMYQAIIDREPDPAPGEPNLAALTMTDRTLWAENRETLLLSNATNAASLNVIESGMAVGIYQFDAEGLEYGTLDEQQIEGYMREMLTGAGNNRWMDKSFNVTIYSNGRSGGTVEHSWGDGCEYGLIREMLVRDEYAIGTTDDGHAYGDIAPTFRVEDTFERLRWDFSPKCESAINSAYELVRADIDDLEVATLMFTDYGKGLVKKAKMSPDAWFQMAMQLAYYRINYSFKVRAYTFKRIVFELADTDGKCDSGAFCLTYESASARFFVDGRTETYRVGTKHSCAFVRAMCDTNSNKAERLSLLRAAGERHQAGNRLCLAGEGFDRHLFALYVLSIGTGNKSAFLDYVLAQEWTLSTSQAPTVTKFVNEEQNTDQAWLGPSFGPVSSTGYGICYRPMGEQRFVAHITARHSAKNTSAKKMRDLIRQSLMEMRDLVK